MSKVSLFVLIVIGIFLAFLWAGSISVFREYTQLKHKNDTVITNMRKFKTANKKLFDDVNYYKIPENLEKKLRQDFNYKKPGEKMIIIVPRSNGTTTE